MNTFGIWFSTQHNMNVTKTYVIKIFFFQDVYKEIAEEYRPYHFFYVVDASCMQDVSTGLFFCNSHGQSIVDGFII